MPDLLPGWPVGVAPRVTDGVVTPVDAFSPDGVRVVARVTVAVPLDRRTPWTVADTVTDAELDPERSVVAAVLAVRARDSLDVPAAALRPVGWTVRATEGADVPDVSLVPARTTPRASAALAVPEPADGVESWPSAVADRTRAGEAVPSEARKPPSFAPRAKITLLVP